MRKWLLPRNFCCTRSCVPTYWAWVVSASLVHMPGTPYEAPNFSRALHMGLTVRDMDASAAWYQRVLGFRLVKRFDAADGVGIPRTLLLHPSSGFLVGLYNHKS